MLRCNNTWSCTMDLYNYAHHQWKSFSLLLRNNINNSSKNCSGMNSSCSYLNCQKCACVALYLPQLRVFPTHFPELTAGKLCSVSTVYYLDNHDQKMRVCQYEPIKVVMMCTDDDVPFELDFGDAIDIDSQYSIKKENLFGHPDPISPIELNRLQSKNPEITMANIANGFVFKLPRDWYTGDGTAERHAICQLIDKYKFRFIAFSV
eukprot:893297_1